MRFTMWGKTEQRKTTGKNLLSNDPTEWTMEKTLEWGANKDFPINLINNPKTAVIDVTIKPSCNYFFLNKEKEKLWVNRIIEKNNEGQGIKNHALYRNESQNLDQYTFVTNAETASIFFQIVSVDGELITEADIQNNLIMLAEGSSVSAYEPYSGGKPSPSPDWEQPIEITDQPVTVTIKGGTEQQSITLTPPKPMTKWDKLEKVDGVWCWVYQTKKYTVTGEEVFAKGGDSYVQGSSTSFYTSKNIDNPIGADSSLMNRLTKNERVWSKPGEIGYVINANQLHMRFLNTTLGVSDDATEVEKKTAYANYLKAEYAKGTPYELLYAVKESKLIPLSQSEQDKLNALTMYAPETEVTNTGGCNMELTYTVDTKSYVDSKIAAISAAVLEV